jgi:dihydromonapterin reductase / dihydrofolate reductase
MTPIVITGGAQRLGLATARALRQQNYDVVVTYRRFRPVLRELECQGIDAIEADFGTEQGAIDFAETLRKRYDMIRGLIHNASDWMPEGDPDDNASVMRSMLNVHVMAPYLINQRCGGLLACYGETHGHADIIHMTDYVASIGSKKHIAYAASKAALDNLTLSFASKYAPLVKVNSVAPALLMFNQGDDDDYRERARRKSLLGIVPGVEEGVNTIQYILESRYLTGKTIALDGGRHLARAG